MGTCKLCGRKSREISPFLQICRECIIQKPEEALKVSGKKHLESRSKFSLPYPKPSEGVKCEFCGNECKIPDEKAGFCGLSENRDGKLTRPKDLVAEVYYDPHPTNCVPMQFCGSSGVGYPEYSYTEAREYGYVNLSVFCIGCSLDCSFCQNWQYRKMVYHKSRYGISKEEFADLVHDKVSCICFFGGDPCIQMDKINEYCREVESKNKVLRFCLETSGNFNKSLVKEFAPISFRSGGGIKFDLKFYNSALNKAVTGVDNKNTYECFELLGELHKERLKVPFLRASTLLLPGYITPEEVGEIAEFISHVSPDIPYCLLAFHPHFEMKGLPYTSRKMAYECRKTAEKFLERVSVGNEWLLV